ncbi:MAG: L-galactonate transporter [Verrucomicrobiota bacterium]
MNLPSKKGWVAVALLWLVALLNYFDRLMLTSMRDPIKEAIPMSDAQFGLLSAVFLWIYALASPLGGHLADRFGKRRLILASLALWSAVTCWTGYTRTFGELLAARACMGLSEACYIPAALALLSDHHRGRTRSLATGIHMSGIYTGAALGGLGGWAADHWGWRAGFIGFGGFGLLYALVLFRWLEDAPDAPADSGVHTGIAAAPAEPAAPLSVLFGNHGFRILLVVNLFWGISSWVTSAWLPTFLREHFHLSLTQAGFSASAPVQTAAFAGVLLGGFLTDRWRFSEPRARTLLPALLFFLAAPALFFAVSTENLPWAIAGLALLGLSRGGFDANHMPIVRELLPERQSATAYGFLNFCSCSAGGLMIYVGGLMKDAAIDLDLIFKAVAAGLLILAFLLLRVLRPHRAPNPSSSALHPV